jgi:GH15 family glucan-1,4-alpha-glucosidase
MYDRDLYSRSIELIRANQSPGGAYLASPTFEQYRYCWFRDGTYIAYAMDLAGEQASAHRFYDWAASVVVRRAAHVERAIAAASRGEQPAPHDLLHTRYSPDGEDGPAEWPNFQLDGFGTLLWGMGEHLKLTGQQMPGEWRMAVDLLARYLGALWPFPCYDCWEEFGDRTHTSTLAAIYGGLNAASDLLEDGTYAHVAPAIKRFVLDRCVHGGSLCKFVGSTAVDASLLHVATPYRLLLPDHPLMSGTVERIERELRREGGGVHRYAEDSYYGGGEWVLLTAYLGWYYLERGEVERARALLRWVEGAADERHMLPEQVAAHLNYPHMLAVWEGRWGPSACPLLWSHAAYMTLAYHLNTALIAMSDSDR